MFENISNRCSAAADSCRGFFNKKSSTLDNIAIFLAELFGTGLLIFLGCMGCSNPDAFLQNNLNFGLVVMMIIQCFGCVSGAHLNPSVTIAAYIYNLISAKMILLYAVAQFLGAFIGYGLLKLLIPESVFAIAEGGHGFCMTMPHEEVGDIKGCAIEFIITAVLITVCCAVWDPRNAKNTDSVTIRFGLTIASLSLTASTYTGASMNPARSFAPALWNKDFEFHWIYWAGPLAASIITPLIYKLIFRRELPDDGVEENCHTKTNAGEQYSIS